jgi:hypothetical protein
MLQFLVESNRVWLIFSAMITSMINIRIEYNYNINYLCKGIMIAFMIIHDFMIGIHNQHMVYEIHILIIFSVTQHMKYIWKLCVHNDYKSIFTNVQNKV